MGFRGWPQPLLHVLCCTESTIFEFRRWLRTYPLTNNARRVGETFKIMRSPPGHSKIFARSNGARGAHQNSFGRIASRAVRPKQMQWARAQAALRRAAVLRRDVRAAAAAGAFGCRSFQFRRSRRLCLAFALRNLRHGIFSLFLTLP